MTGGRRVEYLAVPLHSLLDRIAYRPLVAEFLGFFERERQHLARGQALLVKFDGFLLRLNQLLVRALKAPNVQRRIAQEGANVVGNSTAEFRVIIESGVRRWHAVAKEAKIMAE
jgi:hypothetical protein